MDLWHYPTKVNNRPGVMELWDFPNGQPMTTEKNNLNEETRLITRDIVAITQNLEDAYPSQDIKQTLNALATSDNRSMQLAYNIIKQLVESHQNLEYELNRAVKRVEHQQILLQQVQPEFTTAYDSEYDYNEEEEEDVVTNIPFFSSPAPPVPIYTTSPTTPLVPEDISEQIFEANDEDQGYIISPRSYDDEQDDDVMNRYDNLMFEDDFAFKPRLTRNNSGNNALTNKQKNSNRRLSKKKYTEELREKHLQQKHEALSMKKLARVRSNPNVRRFRSKKSYLTRREQWSLVAPVGSPKSSSIDSVKSIHKSSISLDSSRLGISKPILDMNRNVPAVIDISKSVL